MGEGKLVPQGPDSMACVVRRCSQRKSLKMTPKTLDLVLGWGNGYFSLSTKSTPLSKKSVENKRPCLEFSKLTVKDSLKELFIPRLKISLMLYTRNNFNCAKSLFEQNNSLNINFNIHKKTVWLIHGYRPMGSTPSWLHNFVWILLNKEDMNLVVVDWNQGAATFIYNRAVKNTRKVAVILSRYIQNLLMRGASLGNFHFIGMSLGAHICGFVGKIFHGELGRITGLDPAGPKFSGKPSNSRLDYTDAKLVDVLHSDAHGLGIQEPLGHIDFYPNGGIKQPGCPTSIFSGIEYIKCNHQRAVYLFMAALQTNCSFVSFPCHSYRDYKTSLCVDCGSSQNNSCPRLDFYAEQWEESSKMRIQRWPLRITAFFDTNDKYPFCAYYFVLSIIALDESMNSGYISLKLLNHLGMAEHSILYEKSKPFYKLQEVKILAQFLNDVGNISRIVLRYFQNSNFHCSTNKHRIQRLMLKSLTYPERPPLCSYNFVLKESEELFLKPVTCIKKI
ncbi:lipase member I [Octodon degus]|uniref:Lipase member H n=1 Tax=Octodon degus TaxID=10160 RepID=A0A6P6F5G2_OCTDE|nr:lipase member I [Octodon degus]